ncbi:hypothetical protein J3A83DRAFT_4375854 [Scleroderma citrinum]
MSRPKFSNYKLASLPPIKLTQLASPGMLPVTDLFERWDWAIDAYRNYLNSTFPRSTTLTLCAITFLTMAELMRLHYARYPPEVLQAGSSDIGYRILKIMFSIPVLGVIAIRVIEIFTVSQSIVLTVCLVVISMIPGEILPAVMYVFHRARNWMNRSELGEGNDMEPAPLPEQTGLYESRFTSTQTRLRSILDTMGPAVGDSAVLDLFIKSIVRSTHRRLRNGGPDNTGPEEVPV